MLLNDTEIQERIENGLITIPKQYQPLKLWEEQTPISRGITSAGYDLTLADNYARFNGIGVVDPLNFIKKEILEGGQPRMCLEDSIILPGGGFMLAHSVEVVNMPTDLVATATGKSTYARCGLIVNVTPIEPGFSGQITLELHNASPNPVKIYPFMGICQLQFHLIQVPEKHYGNKDQGKSGKYQNQMGIMFPKGVNY